MRNGRDTVMVSKHGLIVVSMRGTGILIKQMDMENCIMQMEISMRASGRTIKLMDTDNTLILMEHNMKATG